MLLTAILLTLYKFENIYILTRLKPPQAKLAANQVNNLPGQIVNTSHVPNEHVNVHNSAHNTSGNKAHRHEAVEKHIEPMMAGNHMVPLKSNNINFSADVKAYTQPEVTQLICPPTLLIICQIYKHKYSLGIQLYSFESIISHR